MSACFLSQLEPTSIAKALEDPDWVDAMQEEMQQFINQQVWKLVPLPDGKHAIGTKWILKNKRDARGIVVRNKARLVAQGHRQEEGIDYDEVFAPVARIEAIRLFLAFASYMGFLILTSPKLEYRVVKGCMDFIKHTRACQDKYVKDMLTKFDMESVRTATTPYEAAKTKLKDVTDPPVNVHLYRSMIGSLMYLTASRPDIMFALEAYSDNDYAGSHGDRKSTTGGCQFLGKRSDYLPILALRAHSRSPDFCGYFFNRSPNNQSTICIVKNPVFHQRTKHIEIRHHFIRDANEKNLIQVLKIHTDDNVADLLTKAFDGPSFEYLVVHIGMVVNTAASCIFFLLTGWFLLVVLCFCWHTSAGGFISADRVCVPAIRMVSAVG
ncbi:putative ribonuclease H-like domain-containing protein [Tanacetum coccineum]|uniref:Ribonuclease H-like domain-containing protein n=1 Tax=Tanacetum coccineum TaxID=301880 RepID=A0ABQ5END4_9ASTR